ncbi:MAG TPA: indole-3-glycerol phosphate synthase TrpC [Pyrinomonadaceae bacterium]|nr:indole-3-glycerol phosphate synthase TrpC [Pyrinomonadaceae bacterium]
MLAHLLFLLPVSPFKPFPILLSRMDFLTEILNLKRARLARAKELCSPGEMRERASDARRSAEGHRFRASVMRRDQVNIIAEVKRASPSKGIIRSEAKPSDIARSYEAGGAAAISVLTEEDRFLGSLDDLREVRSSVSLPVLRKDFIFDEFQVWEAAEAGADALLLIAAALDDENLARLLKITEEDSGMDALVEVHTKGEMRRALACGATLIGVNNRDLHTFKVSLDVSIELARYTPRDSLLVSESGLRTGEEIKQLRDAGYSAFLIGETLMRASEPEETLRELIKEGSKGVKG